MYGIGIQLVFENTPDQVWEAWTVPDRLTWFGSDPEGHVLAASLDVREGGTYCVTFQDSDGREHSCFGKYTKVIPHKELHFTWEWASEPGHLTQVSVLLEENNKGTTMHFQHYHLNPNSLHGYEDGWKRTFEKLHRALK